MKLSFSSKWLNFTLSLGSSTPVETDEDGSFYSQTGGDFQVAPVPEPEWYYEEDEGNRFGFSVSPISR